MSPRLEAEVRVSGRAEIAAADLPPPTKHNALSERIPHLKGSGK